MNRIKNVERINSIVKENVIFKEKNDETVTFEVVKAIKENKNHIIILNLCQILINIIMRIFT